MKLPRTFLTHPAFSLNSPSFIKSKNKANKQNTSPFPPRSEIHQLLPPSALTLGPAPHRGPQPSGLEVHPHPCHSISPFLLSSHSLISLAAPRDGGGHAPAQQRTTFLFRNFQLKYMLHPQKHCSPRSHGGGCSRETLQWMIGFPSQTWYWESESLGVFVCFLVYLFTCLFWREWHNVLHRNPCSVFLNCPSRSTGTFFLSASFYQLTW